MHAKALSIPDRERFTGASARARLAVVVMPFDQRLAESVWENEGGCVGLARVSNASEAFRANRLTRQAISTSRDSSARHRPSPSGASRRDKREELLLETT